MTWSVAFCAREDEALETLMSRRFDEGGPVLLAAKVDDTSGTAQSPRDPVLIRQRFSPQGGGAFHRLLGNILR